MLKPQGESRKHRSVRPSWGHGSQAKQLATYVEGTLKGRDLGIIPREIFLRPEYTHQLTLADPLGIRPHVRTSGYSPAEPDLSHQCQEFEPARAASTQEELKGHLPICWPYHLPSGTIHESASIE